MHLLFATNIKPVSTDEFARLCEEFGFEVKRAGEGSLHLSQGGEGSIEVELDGASLRCRTDSDTLYARLELFLSRHSRRLGWQATYVKGEA